MTMTDIENFYATMTIIEKAGNNLCKA